MAKIEYSALVSNIRGKMGGQVASGWKGINYLKNHNASPRQPRTTEQQTIRGYMSELSVEWYALTDSQKLLWNKYASLLGKPMSGQNAYIKLNLNIWRYAGEVYKKTAPPATPSRPGAMQGFDVTGTSLTISTVAWTAPCASNVTVIIDYSPQAGFDDKSSPGWKPAGNVASAYKGTELYHDFPSGTVMRYRAKSMDEWGRMSPPSEIETITVP